MKPSKARLSYLSDMEKVAGRTFGSTWRTVSESGLFVAQAEFSPFHPTPAHEHEHPSILILLWGDLFAHSPMGSWAPTDLTVLFDPKDRDSTVEDGPRGMSILMLECPLDWQSRHQIDFESLPSPIVDRSASTRAEVLLLLSTLSHDV